MNALHGFGTKGLSASATCKEVGNWAIVPQASQQELIHIVMHRVLQVPSGICTTSNLFHKMIDGVKTAKQEVQILLMFSCLFVESSKIICNKMVKLGNM